MNIKKLPEKPRIVLLANDKVGLEITKYLKHSKENIVSLVLHPKHKAKLADKIRKIAKTKNIFYADKINTRHYLDKIKKLKPDLALSMWFGYILKREFIELFPFGCINLHNSYLPLNRGKYAQVWAIYENSQYGVSIHYIDEKIDTGDIITQKKIKIEPTDIAGILYDRSLKEIVKLFINTWPKIKSGQIKPKPQDKKAATYHVAKDVERLDCIDLNKKYKGRELINQLRARSFGDRSYVYFWEKGEKVYVKIVLSKKSKF